MFYRMAIVYKYIFTARTFEQGPERRPLGWLLGVRRRFSTHAEGARRRCRSVFF